MRIAFTAKADRQYAELPDVIKDLVDKQLRFLANDLRHPSIKAKRYAGRIPGLWQGRVNQRYRFYFFIEDDHYLIIAITDHP